MPEPVFPKRDALGALERKMVDEALTFYVHSGEDLPYGGVFQQRFCQEFSAYMGGGFTQAVSSGTAAVYVALQALRPPRGSSVILPPIIDPGVVSATVLQGYRPIFADSAPGEFSPSEKEILDAVTDDTSVVIFAHLVGQPFDLGPLSHDLKARGIRLIEDCSQAPGAMTAGRKVGTFGDIAALSTMYRKSLMTGSSGGLVFTRDETLYKNVLSASDRGKPSWDRTYSDNEARKLLELALNWNSNELACAIGIASLSRLDDTNIKRLAFCRQLATTLDEADLGLRAYIFKDGAAPFFLPIWCDESILKMSKLDFANKLRKLGIPLNPDYSFLVGEWPWMPSEIAAGIHTPTASRSRNQSFNLFLNENYGIQEIDRIVEAARTVLR